MEFVKLSLAAFINFDLDMYHEASDTPATARASSLVEELGQVDYIFSDKTGTLTANIMDLKMVSINGVGYADEAEIPVEKKWREGEGDFYRDFEYMKDAIREGRGEMARDFFILLAVCHTVIPEKGEDREIMYQASSPDEAALVKGAKELGFVFTV
jgi:phospholipid-transporting ATPase